VTVWDVSPGAKCRDCLVEAENIYHLLFCEKFMQDNRMPNFIIID